MFPERFDTLPVYAFPRLRELLDAHAPGGEPIQMTIGEPRHAFPDFVTEEITRHAHEFGQYPVNEGAPWLRQSISDWVQRRYGVSLDPDTRIMALNGTREGLYNVSMALCPETKNGQRPVILSPNPFYQVYMVSALSVQAEPVFVNATAETGHLPDFASVPTHVLDRTAMAYICSPANPQGAVADRAYWETLITLAERHDFKILADECYAEIYRDTPPVGALEVAAVMGADPERVVAFHSLSKRSNLPGLRSGFVAAGPKSIARFKQLRSYAGAPLPMPLQRAAARLWSDEEHVTENRALYRAKFELADRLLGNAPGYQPPQAGFFVWLPVPDGERATLDLWTQTGVKVLPGAYLSQNTPQGNPGTGYIRVAMVGPYDETERGLTLIRDRLTQEQD